MFGFGQEAKAEKAAKVQYDSMMDISRNILDEIAEFIASELQNAGFVEPTKKQIKEMELLQAIIATDMICAELFMIRDYISRDSADLILRACAKEVKDRSKQQDITSVCIYAWVHQRFGDIEKNPELVAQTNKALHFNSISTACLLAEKYEGEQTALIKLSRDTGFHLRLYQAIPRYPTIWVDYINSLGLK